MGDSCNSSRDADSRLLQRSSSRDLVVPVSTWSLLECYFTCGCVVILASLCTGSAADACCVGNLDSLIIHHD